MNKPLVSIIIPCWNEEEVLDAFYHETTKAVSDVQADFEFLFIDDGSTDGTAGKIIRLAESDSRIRLLRLSRNFGSFAAIAAGFHHCRGDAAMCISADLQDPPSLIPQLIDKWQDGHDIVWAAFDGRSDPFLKRTASSVFYWLIRRIALKNIPPQGMNVGMFSRRVIDIYRALPDRDSIPIFTILKMGFPQTHIFYERQDRVAGTSGWSFWRRVRSAIDVIITFSYVPVRMISAIGIVAAILGLIYALVIMVKWAAFGAEVPGWSSLMAVLLIVSGIQMVMLGFITEYLWRQSQQARSEPRYIVMEEIGSAGQSAPANQVIDINNINVAGNGPE